MKKTLLASLLALGFIGSANASTTTVTINMTQLVLGTGDSLGTLVEQINPQYWGLETTGPNTFVTLTSTGGTWSNIAFRLYEDLDGVLDSTADIQFQSPLQAFTLTGNQSFTFSLLPGVYAFRLQPDPTPEGSGTGTVGAVPVPAAAWLFGSALFGAGALRRKQKTA